MGSRELWGHLSFSATDASDRALAHPDDYERLRNNHPLGGFFFVAGLDGEYVVLQHGANLYCVKYRRTPRHNFRVFPTPRFDIGDPVRSTNGTPRSGWIQEIAWHFRREAHLYVIEVVGENDKRRTLKRWYFEQDLEPEV
jgi:hypothetical protein